MDPVYQRLATQHPFSFNAQAYAGARVESIEGRPAWPFMQRWAQVSAGKFRNPGQKLNWAFAHLKWNNGTRGLHPGAFSSRSRNPGRDSVAMTLVRWDCTEASRWRVPPCPSLLPIAASAREAEEQPPQHPGCPPLGSRL